MLGSHFQVQQHRARCLEALPVLIRTPLRGSPFQAVKYADEALHATQQHPCWMLITS